MCITTLKFTARHFQTWSCSCALFLGKWKLNTKALFVNVYYVRWFFLFVQSFRLPGLIGFYLVQTYGSTVHGLVCNRAVVQNHRAEQCDLCDFWVHIACNNLNVYTYQTKITERQVSLVSYMLFSKGATIWVHYWYSTEKIIAWRGCRFPKSKNNFKYNKAKWIPWWGTFSLCTLIYPLFLITILNYII